MTAKVDRVLQAAVRCQGPTTTDVFIIAIEIQTTLRYLFRRLNVASSRSGLISARKLSEPFSLVILAIFTSLL